MLQPIEESVDLRTCPVTLSGVPYQLVEMDGERHSAFMSLFAEDAKVQAEQGDKDGAKVSISFDKMEKMLRVRVKTVALCLQQIELSDSNGNLKDLWATSLENYRNGSSCQGIKDDVSVGWLAEGLKAGSFVQEAIVKAWPNPRIEQLYEAARDISGLTQKDEDGAKNSSEAEKDAGSGSPSNSDSPSEPSSVPIPSATS